MKTKGIGLATCAVLVLAGCATNQGTPTHRMSVEIVGAESADCVSPQAIGEYAITAPGEFLVEPEAPNVEVICNAEGYQETYASFEEVYNDGSAGAIAIGALAGGLMGAAIMSGQDGLDSLPSRVTITMVPEGENHPGTLATADYEKASETVLPTASLAPAYSAVQPPEDSALALARATAEANMTDAERAEARDVDLRQFEARLRGNEAQLIRALNDYNGDTEFAKSPYSGKPHKVKDVARITALEERQGSYLVEMRVTSGFPNAGSDEILDRVFLIQGQHGGLRVLAHGAKLKDSMQPSQAAASASSEDVGDLERFEARLRGVKPQLTTMLNDYNREAEFAMTGVRAQKIKDVARVHVITAKPEGYVVRIVGNSGLGAAWSQDVYDELFLIDNRRGGLRILGHGRQLADRYSRYTG